MAAVWSSLQRDLLGLILEKLDLVAHARFASVCSSWRYVAVENPPINKPLYLSLSHDPDHLVRRFITSFVSSCCWKEVRFIGALDGWLVVLIDGVFLFLLNKGFNSMIPVPIPNLSNLFYRAELSKAVLSSPPSPSGGECTLVLKQHRGRGRSLFYCRLGLDRSFHNLDDSLDFIQDILFYKERLYVLCSSPNTIVIYDHLLNKESQLVTHLDDIPSPSLFSNNLLISGNKVLYVALRHDQYSIFTLVGSNPMEARLSNIDDNSLLIVNPYCSLSITADKHKEFRRYEYHEYDKIICTYVLDNGKEPYEGKEPWPLFFSMFQNLGIKNEMPKEP